MMFYVTVFYAVLYSWHNSVVTILVHISTVLCVHRLVFTNVYQSDVLSYLHCVSCKYDHIIIVLHDPVVFNNNRVAL